MGASSTGRPDRRTTRWAGSTVTSPKLTARCFGSPGLDYLFRAQYPHGGWPQVYPLVGDYHDAVTFNDDAIVNLLGFLQDVAAGGADYAFVSADARAEAAARLSRGIACLLASQVAVEGRLTVWGQQHDALTLAPCAARNYEMVSLSSNESAGILRFLLALPEPSPEIRTAIEAAGAWFARTAIPDVAYRSIDGTGRQLVPAPGAGPLWARMYEIGTDRPIFGDRDKTIHSTLETMSQERRTGYAWYSNRPASVLKDHIKWRARLQPLPEN